MSLKSFLEEEKQLRKQRKLERKQEKKASRPKRLKKLFGVFFVIFLICYGLITSCSAVGGIDNLGELFGITDEMIAELKKPVDRNLLFPNGELSEVDLENCKLKLTEANANVIDSEEELVASKNFQLNSRELGAFVRLLLSEGDNQLKLDILDFEIYEKDNRFYEKSIALVNLGELLSDSTLSTVYITSISEVAVMGDSLCILQTKMQINQVEESVNDKIVTILKSNENFNIVELCNSMINMTIDLYAGSVRTNIKLVNDGIKFIKKG